MTRVSQPIRGRAGVVLFHQSDALSLLESPWTMTSYCAHPFIGSGSPLGRTCAGKFSRILRFCIPEFSFLPLKPRDGDSLFFHHSTKAKTVYIFNSVYSYFHSFLTPSVHDLDLYKLHNPT